MKVLVVTWDGGGNRQPFEVIVAELVGRGDSVLVVSNEVHHEVFESLGATFSPLGVADKTLVSRPQLDQQLERLGEVVFSLVTPERVAAAVDAFSPEVTVVDVVMLSAQAAIERARRAARVAASHVDRGQLGRITARADRGLCRPRQPHAIRPRVGRCQPLPGRARDPVGAHRANGGSARRASAVAD